MICTPWYFSQAVFHILCGTITVKHDPLDHEKVQRLILSGDFMSVADALFSKHVECHFVPLKRKIKWSDYYKSKPVCEYCLATKIS